MSDDPAASNARPEIAAPALPPELAPLGFLLGTWVGEGEGWYPTIESFRYREEVTFAPTGKPFLRYGQRTVNLATGLPAHAETGYWRRTNEGRIELVLAHPTGVVEVAEGVLEPTATGGQILLQTSMMGRTATAKEVTAIERQLTVVDDVLRYELLMAAVGQPLQGHLRAELHRQ